VLARGSDTSYRTGWCAAAVTQCAHGCTAFFPISGAVDVRGSQYGLGNCLIDRDGRVIGAKPRELTDEMWRV
jgi:hypothetical protein